MTVVVIDSKPDPKYVFKVVCPNCAVTLEYVRADIKSRQECFMGDCDTVDGITCPNCKKFVHTR